MSITKVYGLTQEERDLAEEIVLHEGWEVLIKIIERHVKDIDDQIHAINPDSKDCGTMLLIARSKSEGARNLLSRIKNLKAKKA
jgi:hypothetical protein